MERFFDNLSRELAKAVTRRDALRFTVRAMVAGLLTSTGVSKLWAATRSVAARQVRPADVMTCPDCGTCDLCDVDAGQCGFPCDDPCTAAALCAAAQSFQPYVTVQQYITDVGFAADGDPTALVALQGGVESAPVLTTTYTSTADPSRTATVSFVQPTSDAQQAWAITFQNGVPDHTYFLTPDGLFAVVTDGSLPPPPGFGQLPASPRIADPAASACESLCAFACGQTDTSSCQRLTAALCFPPYQPGPLTQIALMDCLLVTSDMCGSTCTNICTSVMCNCAACERPCPGSPEGCCPGDHLCSDDGSSCVPLPPNWCGTGQSFDGCLFCLATCASGAVPCGAPGRCCAPGSVCCDQLHGRCCPIAAPICCGSNICCPIGTTCCGNQCCPPGRDCCGGACCPAGTQCCNPQTLSCCPPDFPCCAGVQCCAPPNVCCGGACCYPGFQCCGDHCCRLPQICAGPGCQDP
jgi:hypothetical protein